MSDSGDTPSAQSDSERGRGRFTRMFDREFISDALKRKEQEAVDEAELSSAERAKKMSERNKTAVTIAEHFCSRNTHLKGKFPEMRIEQSDDELDLTLILPPGRNSAKEVKLEFEVEISHQGAAFHVHSRTTFEGKTVADKMSFAERKLDVNRVDRFIERKILDFVRRYLGE